MLILLTTASPTPYGMCGPRQVPLHASCKEEGKGMGKRKGREEGKGVEGRKERERKGRGVLDLQLINHVAWTNYFTPLTLSFLFCKMKMAAMLSN